ncbi:MAG: hypothetical protein AAFV93_17025 [Chloroflexota bacterium]
MPFSSQHLKEQAQAMGFNLVGITQAVPSPTLDAYYRWIDAGMHGKMGYLAREDRRIRRDDLNNIVDGAQSIVMVGLDYRSRIVPLSRLHPTCEVFETWFNHIMII